ncbi:MAG: 3-oxoacyl-ACP synthase III family protein [Gammaproteobacteria bacterium]
MELDWSVRIVGLGHSVPPRMVANVEIARRFECTPEWIGELTGVESRHHCEPQTGPGAIAIGAQAAREAIEDAGLARDEVDLIVNASGTQVQAIPDGASLLQRELGLGASGVPCVSIHTTCLSFLNALQFAGALLHAGVHRRVLIVSSEAASAGLDPQDVETSALMGDAAAAAVVQAVPPGDRSRIHALHFETYGEGSELTVVRGGGTRNPPLAPHTRPGDHYFQMDKRSLLKLMLQRLPPFLERVWPGHDLRALDHVVPHQASPATFSLLERVGFAPQRVHESLSVLGNCVAASIPATLYRAVRAGAVKRGDRVLLLGSGAGVSFGAAVLTY